MSIVQRVKDILLAPKATWPVIEAEPADVKSLFVPYVMVLAAIPVVAAFIGLSLIGVGGMGMNFRIPVASGLASMVVSYVLSLVMVYVLALIVDALAPTFGGVKNPMNALKVVVYGSTAGFLGGIFNLLPALSILGLLAALYSIYLIYTGLPALMKSPPDKSVAYTAVIIVCGIVAGVVIGAISALITPSQGPMRTGSAGDISITTPEGEVKLDTAKMEQLAKKMEEAGKQMEAAQKSGDTAAAGQAATAMLGAMTGGQAREVVPAAQLKALLPESIAGLKRESFDARSGTAMGIASSVAKGRYRNDDGKQFELEITDTGGLAALTAAAGWASLTTDRETDGEVEKIYRQGKRTVREQYRKDGSHGEYTVILPNGVMVEGRGEGLDPAQIRKAVEGVDLAKLEALQAPAK